jgi:hypothetical protein
VLLASNIPNLARLKGQSTAFVVAARIVSQRTCPENILSPE